MLVRLRQMRESTEDISDVACIYQRNAANPANHMTERVAQLRDRCRKVFGTQFDEVYR